MISCKGKRLVYEWFDGVQLNRLGYSLYMFIRLDVVYMIRYAVAKVWALVC